MARSKRSHCVGRKQGRPAPKGFRRPAQFSADEHIGINQVYGRVKDGSLPHVRFGRTILIPDDALDRMVAAGKP